ncbi:MAG TPA: hypothetical protein VK066_16100 [Chloroflexota bacterium]|nr:hypothetical protein [Chloroflexota bacterium]
MFWLKRCPQCGGDLMDESDVQGSFISCLQCGRMLTLGEEQALRREKSSSKGDRLGGSRVGAA